MSFLNPWALLGLLAAVPLVLLYFLKLKRPHVRVASTLLWQKVIEDMRVNSPFQRLRRSLLLVLQLLALVAVVGALARPILRARETVNQSLIVLLDTSASMETVEAGGKTRLDLARAEIGALVDNLARDDEMMLITFHSRAAVACGFTGNRPRLKEVLGGFQCADSSTAIEPGLLLAKSLANTRGHPRILVFSDGAVEAPESVDMPVEVEYRKIGTSRPNFAITGLDLRRSIRDRSRIEMFVAVENLSTESFAGNMTVYLDEAPLDSKAVSVGPQETLSQIFEATLPAGGCIQVRFDAEDALACDNQAWKVAPPPVLRRVLVVGDNTFFVERALRASPGIECRSVLPVEYTDEAAAGCSTVIWCAAPRPEVAPANNLYLGCFPPIAGLTPGATIETPAVLDWDNTHPVNRFLDYDNLLVASTMAFTLPAQGAVIVRSARTPLIGLVDTDHGTACVVGFDPIQSNWPLLLSFPLFLNSCLDYFEERASHRIEANIPVGRTITVPSPGGAPSITLPGGETREMTKNPGGDYSFAATDRCGLYRVKPPAGEAIAVAANLFDRRESTLDPAESLVIGKKTIKAADPQKQTNKEYWKLLVAGLGLLLLGEWAVYHRRWFV